MGCLAMTMTQCAASLYHGRPLDLETVNRESLVDLYYGSERICGWVAGFSQFLADAKP